MKFFEELKGFEKEKTMRFVSLFAAIIMVMFGCASINSDHGEEVDVSELVVIVHNDENYYEQTEEQYDADEDNVEIEVSAPPMSDATNIIDDIVVEESSTEDYDSNISEEVIDGNLVSEEEIKLVLSNKKFTADTDIGKGMSNVTAEMIDEVTEHYSKYQSFDNPFKGKGYIFIEAQEKSGLDALFIYSLAVWESGWGTSDIAKERCNYFGIGSWDIDLDRSLYMGDDLYTGIVNGAVWIAQNYYENDQTTLTLMNTIPHKSYAPSNKQWIPHMVAFINDFCDILEV